MQVRKFNVADVKAGLRQIKSELGPEAVILSTARQPDGSLEISVAVDPQQKAKREAKVRKLADALGQMFDPNEVEAAIDSFTLSGMSVADDLEEPPTIEAAAPLVDAAPAEIEPTKPSMWDMLGVEEDRAAKAKEEDRENELAALRAMVGDLTSQIRNLKDEAKQAPVKKVTDHGQRAPQLMLARLAAIESNEQFSRVVSTSYEWLRSIDVADEHIEDLLGEALRAGADAIERKGGMAKFLRAQMAERIQTCDPLWYSRSEHCEVAMLFGPTGVGKTTTCAKIAAHAALVGHKRVAIICADTFRIGAAYQIETYADLLGVPVRRITALGELRGAIEDLRHDVDLILIDTAGVNPWGPPEGSMGPASLQRELTRMQGINVSFHLCLSAATRGRDCMSMAQKFGEVQPDALIFTKLDESRDSACCTRPFARAGCPSRMSAPGRSCRTTSRAPRRAKSPVGPTTARFAAPKKEVGDDSDFDGSSSLRPSRGTEDAAADRVAAAP